MVATDLDEIDLPECFFCGERGGVFQSGLSIVPVKYNDGSNGREYCCDECNPL